ncbi:hypothetical protein BH11PLA2_BH11PLA2_51820 [soil metagenome]
MLGRASKVNFNNGSTDWNGAEYEQWTSTSDKETFEVRSLVYSNFTVGTSEDQLYAEHRKLPGHASMHDAAWNKVDSRKMTTVNGMPCLELRWHYNDNWMEDGNRSPRGT